MFITRVLGQPSFLSKSEPGLVVEAQWNPVLYEVFMKKVMLCGMAPLVL